MRNTESEKVDTVDACCVQSIVIVQEGVLEAAGFLSQSRGCSQEPAVPKEALSDVQDVDSAVGTEEGVVTCDIGSSLPGDHVLGGLGHFAV